MHQIYQKNQINLWLISTMLLLVSLIWIGGLTRLTGSGLSITEWEVFSGILPPMNQNQWIEYFELYKKIPEYQKINYGMSLDEFKIIFWWEYIHRVLARILVLAYIIPLIFFVFRSYIDKTKIFFFSSIFVLFLFQGFMGWYMVKSGLVSETDVSHYRLAAHKFLAVIIFSMILWSWLNINSKKFIISINIKNILMSVLIFLILMQIIWGAFTSGLNAGLLYQTWPLMNDKFIADDIVILNIFSKELFSNPSYVQLFHRLMAYFILLYSCLIYVYFRKNQNSNFFKFIFFALAFQIILGILTLVSGLNIYLASLHQMGSILLLSSAIYGLFCSNKAQNIIDTQSYKQ